MNKPYINAPQMLACIASYTVGMATGPLWGICGGLYFAC